ncbi:hypothetical protein JKP88DRAFT_252508 [Tribonema minus]|uniref:RGS domain-containing protein n=1 Tax=Tribonema minus TaxID=303371 RepID=A0A835ZGE4_9STRA|nr:hypothetical protein JKP88DRAFT_252508 [Tribonema minus]
MACYSHNVVIIGKAPHFDDVLYKSGMEPPFNLESFEVYAKLNHFDENIAFWRAVEAFKATDTSTVSATTYVDSILQILETYVMEKASAQATETAAKQAIAAACHANGDSGVSMDLSLFDCAQDAIKTMVERDQYSTPRVMLEQHQCGHRKICCNASSARRQRHQYDSQDVILTGPQLHPAIWRTGLCNKYKYGTTVFGCAISCAVKCMSAGNCKSAGGDHDQIFSNFSLFTMRFNRIQSINRFLLTSMSTNPSRPILCVLFGPQRSTEDIANHIAPYCCCRADMWRKWCLRSGQNYSSHSKGTLSNNMTVPPDTSHLALIIIVANLLAYFADFPYLFIYLLYGFVARTLCGPRLDPQALLVLFVVRPLAVDKLGLLKNKFVPSPPKRFSQAVGAFFSMLCLVFALVELWIALWVVSAMFLGAALLALQMMLRQDKLYSLRLHGTSKFCTPPCLVTSRSLLHERTRTRAGCGVVSRDPLSMCISCWLVVSPVLAACKRDTGDPKGVHSIKHDSSHWLDDMLRKCVMCHVLTTSYSLHRLIAGCLALHLAVIFSRTVRRVPGLPHVHLNGQQGHPAGQHVCRLQAELRGCTKRQSFTAQALLLSVNMAARERDRGGGGSSGGSNSGAGSGTCSNARFKKKYFTQFAVRLICEISGAQLSQRHLGVA